MARSINQKSDTFALAITRPEDLPEEMRSRWRSLLTEHGEPQISVFAPPLTHLPSKTQPDFSGCALAVYDDILIVVPDNEHSETKPIEVPFDDVISLEMGNILLYSWLNIIFGTNSCRHFNVPFNTVTKGLFESILRHIRARLDADVQGLEPMAMTQDKVPLKFVNAVQEYLDPDEYVIDYAFQPEIRAARKIFLGEQISPPFLTAITNRQGFVIVEEAATSRVPIEQYGETYHYCPYSRIAGAGLMSKGHHEHLSDFHLSLVNGSARHVIGSFVEREYEPPFSRLIDRIKEVQSQGGK